MKKIKKNIYYNLDIYLAKEIAKHLKNFKEMARNSTPSSFFADIKDMTQVSDEETNLKFEKWQHTLDEMIWTFEYISKKFDKKVDANCFEINDFNEERKRIGLLLFAKYFESLWE